MTTDTPRNSTLLRSYLKIFVLFVVSRMLFVYGLLFFDGINGVEFQSVDHFLQTRMQQFDVTWYNAIASHGYGGPVTNHRGESRYAFYPATPWLAVGISKVTGLSTLHGGMIVTNICFLGALALFYNYCQQRKASEEAAMWATALMAFAPQGFIFSAFYSESIFLFFSLGALVAFNSRKPWLSGGLAALSSFTRSNGILVGVYFLWEFISGLIRQKREGLGLYENLKSNSGALIAGALTPLGLFAFWWFCYVETGDPFAQKHTASAGWGWHAGLPWDNVKLWLESGKFHNTFWAYSILTALVLSFSLAYKGLWPDFSFCILNFLMYFSGTLAHSLLRYSIAIFPIYLGLSLLSEKRPLWIVVLISLFSVVNILVLYGWYNRNIIGI